jgi:hypothetical protein
LNALIYFKNMNSGRKFELEICEGVIPRRDVLATTGEEEVEGARCFHRRPWHHGESLRCPLKWWDSANWGLTLTQTIGKQAAQLLSHRSKRKKMPAGKRLNVSCTQIKFCGEERTSLEPF